ncbi:MAG TPA: DinB family protein [Puia sp.]|nr:DinB family protein [Puia sp.]
MDNQILKETESTGEELIKILSSFSQEQLNKVPYAGSWTAGQCAEHINKAAAGVAHTIKGRTRPGDRRPDEKNAAIASVFLDFTLKMQAPDFIIPSDGPHQKEAVISDAGRFISSLVKSIRGSDLSEICLDFEVPGFGPFTREEFVYFALCHTQRHIHQLKKISAALEPVLS